MTLSERVTRLEDLEAIRHLVHELNWLSDQNEFERMLEHHADDVVYDVGSFGIHRGKDAIRSFIEQIAASFVLRLHHVSNQIIELDGQRARSRCYWQAQLEWQGRALVSSGTYLDDLVKGKGRWLLAARKVTIIYMCPLDEGWAKTRIMTLG